MKARNSDKVVTTSGLIRSVWVGKARSLRHAADNFAAMHDGFVHCFTWWQTTNCAYFTIMGEFYIFRVYKIDTRYRVCCVGLVRPEELVALIVASINN